MAVAAALMVALTVAPTAGAAGPGKHEEPQEPLLPTEPRAFSLSLETLRGTFVSGTVPGGADHLVENLRVGVVGLFDSVSLDRWQHQVAEVTGPDLYVTGTSGDLHLHDVPAVAMEVDLLEAGVLTVQVTEPGELVAGPEGSLRVLFGDATGLLWETCQDEALEVKGPTVTLGPVALACNAYFRVRTANDVIDPAIMESALARGELLAEGSMGGWMGDGGWTSVSYGAVPTALDGSPGGSGYSVRRTEDGTSGALKWLYFHVDVPPSAAGTTVAVFLEGVNVTGERSVFQNGFEMERLDSVEDGFAPRPYGSGPGGFWTERNGSVAVVVFDLPGPGSYDLTVLVEGPLPDEHLDFVRHLPRTGDPPPGGPQWWVWPLIAVAGLLISRRAYRQATLKVRTWRWERKK